MSGSRLAESPVKPSSPYGCEVDLDLSKPLSEAEREEPRQLFYENKLVVLHGQQLTLDQQIEFMGLFGKVLTSLDGVTYISTDPTKGGLGQQELTYHSDLAFTRCPFKIMALLAVDVPAGTTSTKFANGVAAYAGLPPETKERMQGLNGLNVHPLDMTGRLQHGRGDVTTAGTRTLRRVVVSEKSYFNLCPQFKPDDPEFLAWLNKYQADAALLQESRT
jgi:hypothetical protein